MKIIYVTTSIDTNDYKEFVKLWKKSPNPSNQNFHNKMIRALAISNELEVVSIRPFSRELCSCKSLPKESKRDGNINWHYTAVKYKYLTRYMYVRHQVRHLFKRRDIKGSVILTDTINPLCMEIAYSLSHKYHLPVVGIATDSPSNIAGTNRRYTTYLLKRGNACGAMIALTDELNDIYNEDHDPYYILEGVVENDNSLVTPKKLDKPYFFFGGALLERYGVYNLIEAFNKLKRDDVRLIIAGHRADEEILKASIGNNQNISYLGTISISEVLEYEKGAIANINPRPFSEDLDRFSIPSKTIEYLSSGVPTISTKSTKLQAKFMDEAIWLKGSSAKDLLTGMKSVLALSEEERKELGLRAKEKVQQLYSLDSVNKNISQFLSIFLRSY